MMYQKAIVFKDTITAEKILDTKDPRQMQKLGRSVKGFQGWKWDEVKDEIVIT